MKIVGTIGYARNTNNAKRNVVKYSNLKTKQSDSTNTYRNNVGEEQESSHQGTGALSPAMNIVPKYYRYICNCISFYYSYENLVNYIFEICYVPKLLFSHKLEIQTKQTKNCIFRFSLKLLLEKF